MANNKKNKHTLAKSFILAFAIQSLGFVSANADENSVFFIRNIFFDQTLFLPPALKPLQTPTLAFNMECWVLFTAANQAFHGEAQKTSLGSPSGTTIEDFFGNLVMEELTLRGLDMHATDNASALQEIRNERVLDSSTPFERMETYPFPMANSAVMSFAPVETIMTMSRFSECEQFAMEKLHP